MDIWEHWGLQNVKVSSSDIVSSVYNVVVVCLTNYTMQRKWDTQWDKWACKRLMIILLTIIFSH